MVIAMHEHPGLREIVGEDQLERGVERCALLCGDLEREMLGDETG
jgi:hypothetical protein